MARRNGEKSKAYRNISVAKEWLISKIIEEKQRGIAQRNKGGIALAYGVAQLSWRKSVSSAAAALRRSVKRGKHQRNI